MFQVSVFLGRLFLLALFFIFFIISTTTESHCLKYQTHFYNAEEVCISGVIARFKHQAIVVLQAVRDEGLQDLKVFIIKGCFEEVKDHNGLLASNGAECELFNNIKHTVDQLSSQNIRYEQISVQLRVFREGLQLLFY